MLKKKKLLSFERCLKGSLIIEPALVHIGAAYGEVLEVKLGNIRKLISKTVWDAAKRCKEADRIVEYDSYYYYKLPIKVSDY